MTNETAESLWARLMDLRDKISQGSGKGAKIEEMIALVEIVGAMLERPALAGVDTLHPGDVVRLRSGGPAMTVLSLNGSAPGPSAPEGGVGWWLCEWYSEATAQVCNAMLPAAALRKVEDRPVAARALLGRARDSLQELLENDTEDRRGRAAKLVDDIVVVLDASSASPGWGVVYP